MGKQISFLSINRIFIAESKSEVHEVKLDVKTGAEAVNYEGVNC